ncbi:hypothetical protein BDR26DRAFT_850685 [Obelidium mucronatum]|nr:hypothetical protein BDR26DRAFT_850685 [Obelidium mucronatum]
MENHEEFDRSMGFTDASSLALLLDRRFSLPTGFPLLQPDQSNMELLLSNSCDSSMMELLNSSQVSPPQVQPIALSESEFEALTRRFSEPFNPLMIPTEPSFLSPQMDFFMLSPQCSQSYAPVGTNLTLSSPGSVSLHAPALIPTSTFPSIHSTPSSSPKSEINPIRSPKKYFAGKMLERERGFDILNTMETAAPTPPETIQSRRSSISEDGRPARFKPTESESALLCCIFQKNPFPSAAMRQRIAEKMGLEMKQVQFWFQNRRASMKTHGVHVLKPRRNSSVAGTGIGLGVDSVVLGGKLSLLDEDNPFFFVEE